MTNVHLNLNNFADSELFSGIFPESNNYEFTAQKVFRLKHGVICNCGSMMVHNGYDYARKKGFGKTKMGKQRCMNCSNEYHEDKIFWKKLLSSWQETTVSFFTVLRDSNVSWQVISKLMNYIIPCSKDKAKYLFDEKIEQFEYAQDNYLIVNYDEQHPKKGRTQKFRLTLLNYITKIPIGEGLFDNKNDATIETFLRQYLDVNKKLIIITDCDRRYPEIFTRIWGNKVIHQKCLLHLNKLVVNDFERNTTLQNEHNKYLFLNIFYNRKKELKFLEKLLKKQTKKCFKNNNEKQEWLKEAKQKFYNYLKYLENYRRREGRNLTQRKLFKATQIFKELLHQEKLFSKRARKRLKMIKENWSYFTAFYHIKDCPATNNAVENYYSTSLKTHRKKQLRTDKGIINHMKLSALKRTFGFVKPEKTMLEIYGLFKLITA